MSGSNKKPANILLRWWQWRWKHAGRVSWPKKTFEANQSLRDRIVRRNLELLAERYYRKKDDSTLWYQKSEALLKDLHENPDDSNLGQRFLETDKKLAEKRAATEDALEKFGREWKFYRKYPHCLDPVWGDSHQFLVTYEALRNERIQQRKRLTF
jgi:ABC-type oligopeptide transport system ATPase subunit